MEVALVSAVTGALKPVLEKMTALLGDEYKRFKGVRKEIKSLTHELTAMDAFLLNMSGEEDPGVQDKVWMNEVRELSYDMEDSIDDFIQHVGDNDIKPDGFIEKIKSSLGKMKARRRIGSDIQGLKKQIIEVGERNERYKTPHAFSGPINAIVDTRALVIFEHASKLTGIDEPKAEIIKLLTEHDRCSSTQQVKIVSIVGPGGMGKTTLANQVYQDLKVKFECRAFLSVSQNPDMMNIMRTIRSQVSDQRFADTEEGSLQQLIINITDFLQDKRYFVVVDDIWDADAWKVIRRAFPESSSSSRIIITTRINDVAESCRSSFDGHVYHIRPLDMVHSRKLFHRRLFDSQEDCPSYLTEVSNQILKKCAGLPLAIIAISSLLANTERLEDLWNQVKESVGRALERNPSIDGMMKILSLSYFDLPPHLKTCLLYLSIFPEDSVIKKKVLIRRWIVERFIHAEGRYTSYEYGEWCFNELLNRNLILPGETDKYGRVKSCRVHDTILDFIISKSIEENFVTLVGVPNLNLGTLNKVRRLSLHASEKENLIRPTCPMLSHVRSLDLFEKPEKIPSLDEFKHLRVLDYGGCFYLENHHLRNIGRLFQLRYLNLIWTNISELPEEIGHLRCLEMLDIRGTEVYCLPSSIVNLKKLSKLLVKEEARFPNGIENMQALEMLKHVSLFRQPSNFAQELGQLKNLMKLVLDFVDYSDEFHEAIASCLHNLGSQSLRSLTILWGDNFLQQGPLCPMPLTLQKLVTTYTTIPRVPNWMGSLVNLQHLRLEVTEAGQEDLCILGALPALLILDLVIRARKTSKYTDWLRVSCEVGFQCLKKFYYRTQPEPAALVFMAGSMPRLEILEINYGPDGTESLDFGIENLPRLTTATWIIHGKKDVVEAEKAALERAGSRHPNYPTLVFRC
ncbi:hypothetical protein CFC21_094822 [Triticum aestivum]|uniref:AAA+ ATPase domain-containing protein n=2 Tax=Triticum aestivum TaxID=4565 RepID=A0A3B6QPS4_WHEAT|nr:disease resistance protein RGA5-like [Triticum aestivum]KAF7092327.1 hypothetical protein CFC21_094822 [Triticum aestivum]